MTPPPTTPSGRTYLDVPYADKDTAKAAGARWDPTAKRWYDPTPPTPGLEPWVARPEIPDLLPGEDREFGHGLFVDLIPASCWFTNVRTCVSPQDWGRLSRMITTRAHRRCEICGAREDRDQRRWLEAHERWHYDPATRVQALRRLICLCTDCHRTTHYGHAQALGREADAYHHLRQVTGMSDHQAHQHIAEAFELWKARSAQTWALNLDMLTTAGITLATPQPADARPAAADRGLADTRTPASTPTAEPPTPFAPTPRVGPRSSSWFRRFFDRP